MRRKKRQRKPDGFLLEHRERARFMRSKGVQLSVIAELLGRPVSTVWDWTKDVPRPPLEEIVSFRTRRRDDADNRGDRGTGVGPAREQR